MSIGAGEITRLREFYRGTPVMMILAELEKARAEGQRQYDHNVEQIAKFAAVEAERDFAREMLRAAVASVRGESITIECGVLERLPYIVLDRADKQDGRIILTARIAAALGDKP